MRQSWRAASERANKRNESKAFFFEKKNQKTFIPAGQHSRL
jgi:hypothetical protein